MYNTKRCECCKTQFLERDMCGNLCSTCYDFIKEYQNKRISELEQDLSTCKQDAELIAMSNSGLAKMVSEKEHQIKVLEKALELACLVISRAMCPNGNWEMLKKDFANAYKEQAKEIMKSE